MCKNGFKDQKFFGNLKFQYDIAEDYLEVKMTIKVNLILRKDDILTVLLIRIFFLEENEEGNTYCQDVHTKIKTRYK